MKLPIFNRSIVLFASFIALLSTFAFLQVQPAFAALSTLSDTLSNDNANASSTHSYSFKVNSGSAITSISITASTAWGATPPTSGWTVKDNATSETVGSVTTSTTVITIPVTSFAPTSGDVITITNTTGWTSQSSTGTYMETINDGVESGVLAYDLITNDQVSLTAIVGPTITFSLSANSLTLPPSGDLAISTTTNASNTITLTLSTNATGGAVVTVSDANQGLTSAAASHTIPTVTGASPVALANGTEAYGMGENTAPSAGTIATRYNTGAISSVGQLFAASSAATFWTLSGPTNSATATPYFNTDISATTPAGTYTDTATYLATGTF